MGSREPEDDTILIARSRKPPRRQWLIAVGSTLLVAITGLALLLRVELAPAPALPLAGETEILDARPTELTIVRFKGNPRILVLEFPSLRQQGRMFDRLAALVELTGFPRDRLATETEIAGRLRDEPGFYSGFDFRSADVVRLFALADRDKLRLLPEEERLRELVHRFGWSENGLAEAIITLPNEGEPGIDAAARATILRHELSHGEYFTIPAYEAYVAEFWIGRLREPERSGIDAFLERQGYDPGNDDLMLNEGQAYLLHTYDERFVSARLLRLSPERLAELRQQFAAGLPPGWLRAAMLASLAGKPDTSASE